MPATSKTRLQKRLEIIDRHKRMLDALKKFVKKHPRLINEYSVKELNGAKLGFKFGDYVLIVPMVKNENVMLQLWKSGEDWLFNMGNDAYTHMDKLANEDVSGMTTRQIEKPLDELFLEANPEAEDEEKHE
jgi:hypothetical protein